MLVKTTRGDVMDLADVDLIRRALGMWMPRVPDRNYIPASVDPDRLQVMAGQGLLERRGNYFMVTESGAAKVGAEYPRG